MVIAKQEDPTCLLYTTYMHLPVNSTFNRHYCLSLVMSE